jgi:hypothetical protein
LSTYEFEAVLLPAYEALIVRVLPRTGTIVFAVLADEVRRERGRSRAGDKQTTAGSSAPLEIGTTLRIYSVLLRRLLTRWVRARGAYLFYAALGLTLFVGLPALAKVQTDAVKNCRTNTVAGNVLFNFRAERANIIGPDAQRLQLSGDRLIYLGTGENAYVAYDCTQKMTVRVPTSGQSLLLGGPAR